MIYYLDDKRFETDEYQFFYFDKLALEILYHDTIEIREGIDPAKSNISTECMLCHYWFFNHWFEFQDSFYNGCHDFTILSFNFTNIGVN